MVLKQTSVFLENKCGRLYEVAKVLGDNGINIMSLCVADACEFAVARMIVEEPERARDILKEKGFTVKLSNVVACEVEDTPGCLAKVLKPLVDQEMNIDYVYCLIGKRGKNAIVIIRVEESEQAAGALKSCGFRCLSTDDIKSMQV